MKIDVSNSPLPWSNATQAALQKNARPFVSRNSPRIIAFPRQQCGLLAHHPILGLGLPETARGDPEDG
jgi:hypothetical protein